MKTLLLAALLAWNADAAVLRGIVVENHTRKLLARAVVTLQPVSAAASTMTARTPVSGTFEFGNLAAGAYLLKVSRRGFMPLEHGQKRWNSAGTPIFLEESAANFVTMQMYRYSGISGTVLDENDVGLYEHEVIAYRNTRPPQIVARSKSNDRGLYRILGLEPGTYLVRTAPTFSEEGSYLPTFGKETLDVESARPVELEVDQLVNNMDLRPFKGRLVTVSGTVTPEYPNVPHPPPIPITVTLATDTGRHSIVTLDAFQFPGIVPGPYEIYAEAPADNNPIVSLQGAYVSAIARTDATQGLKLSSRGNLHIMFRNAPVRALENGSMKLLARRKDLAGYGPVLTLKPERDGPSLRPGLWEVMLLPPPGHIVSGFSTFRGPRISRSRPDLWNEVLSERNGGAVTFELSSSPRSLSGIVKSEGEPSVGAPVFLEAWDEAKRQRLFDPKSTVTDMKGTYTFRDLAPGTYRLLSTFEYRNPDAKAMESAGAQIIRIEAGTDPKKDLTLFAIR